MKSTSKACIDLLAAAAELVATLPDPSHKSYPTYYARLQCDAVRRAIHELEVSLSASETAPVARHYAQPEAEEPEWVFRVRRERLMLSKSIGRLEAFLTSAPDLSEGQLDNLLERQLAAMSEYLECLNSRLAPFDG